MKLLLFLLPALGSADPVFTLQPHPSKLHTPAITEASGLAVSPSDGNFLWIVNDSGGTAEIHLVTTDGTQRGAVTVQGANNTDWEDMASFTLDGKTYLLIADTGDNNASRDSLTLYIVREPSLPAPGKSLSGKTPAQWTINFIFEGGARDCEAVAVDAKAGKIILLSKRDAIPQIHELPLRPGGGKAISTKLIGTAKVIAPALSFLPHRNQPTGLDLRADGSMAAVVTYYGVFLFPRDPKESWAGAFSRKPVNAASHGLAQAESIAFSRDGKTIFSVSEGTGTPIARFAQDAEVQP